MSFIVVPLVEKDKPVYYADMEPDEIAYHVYNLNKGDSKKTLDYLRSYAATKSNNVELSKKFMRAAEIIRNSEDNQKRISKIRQKRSDTKKSREDKNRKNERRYEIIANSISKYLDSVKSTKDLQSPAMWKLINKLPDNNRDKKDILERIHDYLTGNEEFNKRDRYSDIKNDIQKALFKKSGEVRKHVQTKHIRDKEFEKDSGKNSIGYKKSKISAKSREAAKQTLKVGKELETSKFSDEEKKELEKAISKIPSRAKRQYLIKKLLQSESSPIFEADKENFNTILKNIKDLANNSSDSKMISNDVNRSIEKPDSELKVNDELDLTKDQNKDQDKDQNKDQDTENLQNKDDTTEVSNDDSQVTIQPQEKDKSLFHFENIHEALQYYDKNPTVFTREVLKLIDEYNKFAKSRNLEVISTFKELPKNINDENLEDIFVLNKFLTQI
jgi:hypothetical protein